MHYFWKSLFLLNQSIGQLLQSIVMWPWFQIMFIFIEPIDWACVSIDCASPKFEKLMKQNLFWVTHFHGIFSPLDTFFFSIIETNHCIILWSVSLLYKLKFQIHLKTPFKKNLSTFFLQQYFHVLDTLYNQIFISFLKSILEHIKSICINILTFQDCWK